MNDEVQNALRLARAYSAEKLAWFAPALFQCRIILTEQVAVAAIDTSYNVYWNPKAVLEILEKGTGMADSIPQIAFIWVHEISHVLRVHADRAEDLKADAKLWNIAADLEINDGEWKGLKMPKQFPGLLPEKYDLPNGKLAEWYYHEILENEDLRKEIEESCELEVGLFWDEGSGVHNCDRPWEQNSERQILHPIDNQIVARSVAEKMKEGAKHYGNFPGSWEVWIEEIMQSTTDWKKILSHRMSTAIATGIGLRVDYTFARPSRRQSVYHPIVTPSFSGSRSGSVAVVVDTSGSMGGDELGQAVAEVCKVLEDFQLPVTVIPCDAQAYEPIVLRKPSDRFKVQKLKGGGGTDMIVGIEAALKLRPSPDTILVLTDGYTPYPPKPYKIPVVFGIIKWQQEETPLPEMPPWKPTSVVDILIKS